MSRLAAVAAERGAELASPAQQDEHRSPPAEPGLQRDGTHARAAAGEGPTAPSRKISIGGGLLSGTAAFVGGFVLAGGAHYAGSAGGLREDGIDPRVRLKALPMAVRALAVSTAMSGVLGALALAAMYIGLQVQPVADISSVADAIALARQQRAAVQREFQARLHPNSQQRHEQLDEHI